MEVSKEKFETRAKDLEIWMEENDIGALQPMIQAQLNYGRTLTDENDIGNIWGSIVGMCRTLPDSPIKRGKASTLPTEVSVLIESLEKDALAAYLSLIETNDMNVLICRLGKKSNGLWENDEFAVAMANRVKQSLVKRYNMKIWDGTREGLTSQDFSVIVEDSEE